MDSLKHLRQAIMGFLLLTLASCGTSLPVSMTPTVVSSPKPAASPTAISRSDPVTPIPGLTLVVPTYQVLGPTAIPLDKVNSLTEELTDNLNFELPRPTLDSESGSISPNDYIGISAFPVHGAGYPPLWAAVAYGTRKLEPPRNFFVAIYTYGKVGWQQLGKLDLEQTDYLDQRNVSQVYFEPAHVWLEVRSGFGLKGSCYDLLMYDGHVLANVAHSCIDRPNAGSTATARSGEAAVVLLRFG